MFEGNETQFLKLLNWDVSFSVVVTTSSIFCQKNCK